MIDLGSMQLSFAGNPNFANKLRLYTFNIEFIYENLNFCVYYDKNYIYIL